jgi:hypothetical protein
MELRVKQWSGKTFPFFISAHYFVIFHWRYFEIEINISSLASPLLPLCCCCCARHLSVEINFNQNNKELRQKKFSVCGGVKERESEQGKIQ